MSPPTCSQRGADPFGLLAGTPRVMLGPEIMAAGAVFLAEARQILAHVDRATAIARSTTGASAALRVGIIDSSYDSMPQILHEVQARYPGLVIHQVEASVPEQYQQLCDGRLDVGIGRAALPPPQVCLVTTHQR